jgi:hypothetical protein
MGREHCRIGSLESIDVVPVHGDWWTLARRGSGSPPGCAPRTGTHGGVRTDIFASTRSHPRRAVFIAAVVAKVWRERGANSAVTSA